ncbi:MAG: DUF6851 domain-containing protein, partial [Woeseia sp.]
MYDAWAVYSNVSDTYLLGRQLDAFNCGLNAFATPADIHPAREKAIAYAAYRLIKHRFASSPGAANTINAADDLMRQLGFNTADSSLEYESGSPAALGNYVAKCFIDFGLQDGANEANDYANTTYAPVNPPIEPDVAGNPNIIDLDRWQPISLDVFIGQAGNVIDEPEFLSPEWGQVLAFSLTDADKTTYQRDGFDYDVYFDPGPPPSHTGDSSDYYKWGFSLVAIWGSHLDYSDGIMIDISPATIGNNQQLPGSVSDYPQFYDLLNGGDASQGYAANPVTGAPYTQQLV